MEQLWVDELVASMVQMLVVLKVDQLDDLTVDVLAVQWDDKLDDKMVANLVDSKAYWLVEMKEREIWV